MMAKLFDAWLRRPPPLQRQIAPGLYWLRDGDDARAGLSAFLVVGPYGNYLVHALEDFGPHEPLARAIGGIYKQLLTARARATQASARNFKLFGAAAVTHEAGEFYQPALRIESMSSDAEIFLPAITALPLDDPADTCWYLFERGSRALLFVGDEMPLAGGRFAPRQRLRLSAEARQRLAEARFNLVLPSRFEGDSPFVHLSPAERDALIEGWLRVH